jgi:hypothetical protein
MLGSPSFASYGERNLWGVEVNVSFWNSLGPVEKFVLVWLIIVALFGIYHLTRIMMDR